jgi:hypothetical protein
LQRLDSYGFSVLVLYYIYTITVLLPYGKLAFERILVWFLRRVSQAQGSSRHKSLSVRVFINYLNFDGFNDLALALVIADLHNPLFILSLESRLSSHTASRSYVSPLGYELNDSSFDNYCEYLISESISDFSAKHHEVNSLVNSYNHNNFGPILAYARKFIGVIFRLVSTLDALVELIEYHIAITENLGEKVPTVKYMPFYKEGIGIGDLLFFSYMLNLYQQDMLTELYPDRNKEVWKVLSMVLRNESTKRSRSRNPSIFSIYMPLVRRLVPRSYRNLIYRLNSELCLVHYSLRNIYLVYTYSEIFKRPIDVIRLTLQLHYGVQPQNVGYLYQEDILGKSNASFLVRPTRCGRLKDEKSDSFYQGVAEIVSDFNLVLDFSGRQTKPGVFTDMNKQFTLVSRLIAEIYNSSCVNIRITFLVRKELHSSDTERLNRLRIDSRAEIIIKHTTSLMEISNVFADSDYYLGGGSTSSILAIECGMPLSILYSRYSNAKWTCFAELIAGRRAEEYSHLNFLRIEDNIFTDPATCVPISTIESIVSHMMSTKAFAS